jgi:FdhD protein
MVVAMRREIARYTDGTPETVIDELVAEAPVEFRLGDVPIAVLMRTPGNDEELGLGFAITEGIVLGPDEVGGVHVRSGSDGDRYDIHLADGVVVDPEQFRRNLFTTSSCGVCGKASIDAVRVAARHVPEGPAMSAGDIAALPDRMRDHQSVFDTTGSIHAAAAFSAAGDLIAVREDVGRHNAVDKLVGHLASESWPLDPMVLVVSGRISFELVQKAAVAGIPVIAGVSGASSLAVDLGEELGMTIVGFLRGDRFNLYTGSERIE